MAYRLVRKHRGLRGTGHEKAGQRDHDHDRYAWILTPVGSPSRRCAIITCQGPRDGRGCRWEYRVLNLEMEPSERDLSSRNKAKTAAIRGYETVQDGIARMMTPFETEAPQRIMAVRATYANYQIIREQLGHDVEEPRGEPPEVWGFFTVTGCLGGGHRVALHPDDWLIRDEEPGYKVLPDRAFRAKYVNGAAR